MVLDIAQADPSIRFGHRADNIHGRAPAGHAVVHAVAIVPVDAGDLGKRALADKLLLLLRRLLAVAAQRKHQRNILRQNAGFVQLVQKQRQDLVARQRAGHVARNDRDRFPGADDLPQALCPDGILQRAGHLFHAGQRMLDGVGKQHADEVFVRHGQLLRARAKAEIKLHTLPPDFSRDPRETPLPRGEAP